MLDRNGAKAVEHLQVRMARQVILNSLPLSPCLSAMPPVVGAAILRASTYACYANRSPVMPRATSELRCAPPLTGVRPWPARGQERINTRFT